MSAMLDQIRIVIYISLGFILFAMYQAWEKDHPAPTTTPAELTKTAMPDHFVPSPTSNTSSAPAPKPSTALLTPANQKGEIVTIKTDVLQLAIDTRGGDIIQTQLLQYPDKLHSAEPTILLNDDPNTRYVAETGLLSQSGPDTSDSQAFYATDQKAYVLQPNQKEIQVKLNWSKDGLHVTKTFTIPRNSYEVKVSYDIQNQSNQAWQGNLYAQLMRLNTPPKTQGGMINLTTYFGAAVSSPQKPFLKIPFKDMQGRNFSQTIQGGWAAMIQHYFISAWIPEQSATFNYYSRTSDNGLYTIGMIGQPLTVPPGATATTSAKLYTGPAVNSFLKQAAPHLQLTIDYGWFWIFSNIIFWMMQFIYNFVGNWGWAIIIVTIVIKLLFYPLSAKSYRSMSMLKKLQPRIEALKEKFGDDRQKLTQATLELYRHEKVNPMGGCLPILFQIPVFIALYWVLVESVELRQAPFIFWIHDLSQPDPWYVLPILMMISMFAQQKLNPPPADPLQAKVMMAMPVVFMVMFANFPAGLMLYWVVNNTLSFLQQWYVMHSVSKEKTVHKK